MGSLFLSFIAAVARVLFSDKFIGDDDVADEHMIKAVVAIRADHFE